MALGNADKQFLIQVKADIQSAVKDMGKLTRELDKQKLSAGQTNKAIGPLGRGFAQLGAAAAAYVSVQSAIKALKIADEFNLIEARIKRVTAAQGDYNQVSTELFEISQRTGVALKDTADLFIGINRAAEELGATRDQVLAVSNAIQQLGVLSGTSDVALGNALRQFSQAMAGGVLRAEEFNSIVENTPEIATRIAKGMGTTVGKLRLAVVEGKVLSEDVFNALLSQSAEINQEFASAPQSLEASGNRVSNAFGKFLSQLDRAIGGTQTLKAGLDGLARLLEAATPDDDTTQTERQAELQRERLSLFKQQRDVLGDIAKLEQVLADEGPDDVVERELEKQRQKARDIKQRILDNQVLLSAQNQAALDQSKPATQPDKPTSIEPPDPEAERRQQRIDSMIASLKQQAETYGQTAEQIAIYRLKLEEAEPAEIKLAQSFAARVTAMRTANEVQNLQIRLLKAQGETGLASIVELEREYLATVERMKQSGNLAGVELAEKLFSTEVAAIQLNEMINQFERAKEQMRSTEEDLHRQAEVGLLTELDVQERIAQVRRETADSTRELVGHIAALGGELGGSFADEAARAEKSWKAMSDMSLSIKSSMDQQIDALQLIIEKNQAIVDVRHRAGITTDMENLREQEAANRRQIELLKQQAAAYEAMGNSNAAERVRIQIIRLRGELDLVADKFREVFEDAFTSFYDSLLNRTKSFGDALTDLFRDILREINRMVAKELAQQTVKILSGKAGDNPAIEGRGLFSLLGDLFFPDPGRGFSLFHTGGIVGQPASMSRNVHPMEFVGAPRYHTGGFPGIQPNEVALIAQKGEEILSRHDPRNALNGGANAGAAPGVRIINVIDPDLVQDYMDSSSGEDAVLNLLSRRRGDVQAMLS